MAALAMNHPEEWTNDDATPLVRAMAELALSIVQRIVVRSLAVAILQETKREGEGGAVHEVIGRTGVRLRGPFTLLRWHRRPLVSARLMPLPDEPPGVESPRRA